MKTIILDFVDIQQVSEMHALLANSFGFPSFYGANVNALIDCWSSLRFPEDQMTEIVLNKDEQLILEIRGLSTCSDLIINHLLSAVSGVNFRNIELDTKPSILVLPT